MVSFTVDSTAGVLRVYIRLEKVMAQSLTLPFGGLCENSIKMLCQLATESCFCYIRGQMKDNSIQIPTVVK